MTRRQGVAALVFTLEALAAAVTSWIVLGDALTPTQWLGGMLILGGALLPFVTKALPKRDRAFT